MLETIADKLNETAEEKDLAKQYMPDKLDTETDFYNLILFLLVQKKLACYNMEETQQGVAYVNGCNPKTVNQDIVRLIQFAKDIFHCSETQTIFHKKIFSQRAADNRNYIPVLETIYTEYTFDFQISFYQKYKKSMYYIGACLLKDAFDLLFSKYSILDTKRSVQINYPVYFIAERTDGYIGYYLLS